MYFQTSLPNERLNFLLRIIESFENGPFSSSINHNIQNEAKCKTFVTKMRSNGKLHENKELFSYQRLCISARFKAAALDISEKSLSFRQHAIIEIWSTQVVWKARKMRVNFSELRLRLQSFSWESKYLNNE